MRNFEECKAEVFRRSEKRIMQRRQRRNHILMACIPLVLCITIWGAFIFPNLTPEGVIGLGETRPTVEETGGYQIPSLISPIAKITVAGTDLSLTYTDVSDILLISKQLYSYGTRNPSVEVVPGDSVNPDDTDTSQSGSENTGYSIAFIMQNGEKTEYSLVGNKLKNLTTHQTYTLSQKDVNELKTLLGIPHA